MTQDERNAIIEGAKILMLEAMTLEQQFGPKVTVAALLSCASAVAVEAGVSPRAFAEMALGTVEAMFPDACDADEDWRP